MNFALTSTGGIDARTSAPCAATGAHGERTCRNRSCLRALAADLGDLSSSKVMFAVPPDSQLTRLLDANRYYKDDPPDLLWPEMGFYLAPWNGQKKSYEAGFILGVGRYDLIIGAPNHISLHLGKRAAATHQPWSGSQVRRILSTLADAWDVQYGRASSSNLNLLLPRAANEKYIWPMAGWVTYLRSPYSHCVHPSSDIAVERLPDGGMIAAICNEPFNPDDPHHQRLLVEMNEALGPAQKIWKWDE